MVVALAPRTLQSPLPAASNKQCVLSREDSQVTKRHWQRQRQRQPLTSAYTGRWPSEKFVKVKTATLVEGCFFMQFHKQCVLAREDVYTDEWPSDKFAEDKRTAVLVQGVFLRKFYKQPGNFYIHKQCVLPREDKNRWPSDTETNLQKLEELWC